LIKKSHLWYEKDAEIQPGGETIDIKDHTIQALTAVVEKLPIGTNLALHLHCVRRKCTNFFGCS
jgi:hypothetical protein